MGGLAAAAEEEEVATNGGAEEAETTAAVLGPMCVSWLSWCWYLTDAQADKSR